MLMTMKMEVVDMKRALLFFMIVIFTITFLPRAEALEIGLGGMVWYGWWKAPWTSGRTNRMPPGSLELLGINNVPVAVPTPINPYRCDPMPIAGPVISLSLHPRLTLASVFMIGKYHAKSTGNFLSPFGVIVNSRYKKNITKFDLDSSLSVGLTDVVKLFVGVKYQGYDYTEDIRFPNATLGGIAIANHARDRLRSLGPGFGVGLTFHLVENLYLLCNAGGLVLFGHERYRYRWNSVYVVGATLIPLVTRFNESRFYAPGGNASLSLAYAIPKAHLTLTLGGRGQVLNYVRKKSGIISLNEAYNVQGKYDQIYGITFAAVYSIKLTKDKKEIQ